jgi:O-antigen/teichoic acid export membrane protein
MATEAAQPPPLGEPGTGERPLAPDVVLMLATKVSLLALNLGITIVVARALGPTGRGAVAVAFSFTLLLIQFGSLGVQTANPYFAARHPESIGRIVANTLWFAAVAGLLLIGVGLLVKGLFPAALRGLGWLEIVIVLVGLPAALASQLFQSILLAEGRMKAYNGIEFANVLSIFLLLIVGYLAFDMGVTGTVAVMVGVNIVIAGIYLALLLRHQPPLGRVDTELIRRMLRYGFRIYVAALSAYLVGRVNLILVNSLLGGSSAGLFAVCVALAEGMFVFPGVVALNLFPRVARSDDYSQSAAVFRNVAVLFALFCLVTVPLAGPGIRLLFGGEFDGAEVIYYWMLPGIFSYGMLNILSHHFAGRGFPLEAVLVWVPGIFVNLAIIALFLPGHEAWIAALASSVAYVLILLLHMRLFAKESGGYGSLLPRPREVVQVVGQLLRGVLRRRPA